ncbi:MAG: PadR family transcriptional regulator [Lachnospiraceae bacterium]
MANEKKLDCVILGLLSDGYLTGYEIKKRLDTTLKLFWGASYGSIYPTLKLLEEKEYALKIESEENGRKKNIYSITEKGQHHLRNWLMQPVDKDEIRYETLLKLFFGDSVGTERTLKHIVAFEEKIKNELPYLKSSVSKLESIVDLDTAHVYYLLTAKFGLKIFQAYIEWCEEAKKTLGE